MSDAPGPCPFCPSILHRLLAILEGRTRKPAKMIRKARMGMGPVCAASRVGKPKTKARKRVAEKTSASSATRRKKK